MAAAIRSLFLHSIPVTAVEGRSVCWDGNRLGLRRGWKCSKGASVSCRITLSLLTSPPPRPAATLPSLASQRAECKGALPMCTGWNGSVRPTRRR